MKKELNLQEMNEIKGGVTQEQYCATLLWLRDHNWMSWNDDQRLAWIGAQIAHCDD